MLRIIGAQLRWRIGRSVALLLGVLFATTGFTVLTASTATSRLAVEGTVLEHSRGPYDILVRPAGSRTPLEAERGLVRANFMAGEYGGITAEQWRQIAAMSGVEVAAPIAMLGYGTMASRAQFDVRDLVDPKLDRQVIRVSWTWLSDGGLSVAPEPTQSIVYVTKNAVVYPTPQAGFDDDLYDDGIRRPRSVCGGTDDGAPYEVAADGTAWPLCLGGAWQRPMVTVAQLLPDGRFRRGDQVADELPAFIAMPMAVLAAAIEPQAEAALVGLDEAIVEGRYLDPGEILEPVIEAGAGRSEQTEGFHASILIASESYVDESVQAHAQPGIEVTARDPGAVLAAVQSADDAGGERDFPPLATDGAYQSKIADIDLTQPSLLIGADLSPVIQPGPVRYTVDADGTLRPQAFPPASQAWPADRGLPSFPPRFADDTAFRPMAEPSTESASQILGGRVVGVFDRSLLDAQDPLVAPLETYTPPTALGADERSRALLGDQPLLPNGNPAGYLATSPTILLPLQAVLTASEAEAPISAIRVRVAGLTGFDGQSRERVRLLAEDIARATGLDVEIMLGASGQPQTIALPAGDFGRPALTLAELWSKKGVAATIVQAIDRKSVILFGLILVVCVLFLANAAGAAVRDRRRELAVLACLGWPRHRLAGLIIGEVALLGVVAGTLSALIALPLAGLLDVSVSPGHAALAVPVAILLCALAAAAPALRAARSHPAGAVHRPVALPGRRRWLGRGRSVVGLALTNLRRTPGRTLLGVGALAVGTAGLTLVAAVTWAFHGTVTGTLLGDAVSVRVRDVDLVAVVATLLVGLVAVGDVLYLNLRDRAAELAVLRASGWSAFALGRLVVYEGLGIGLLGAAIGAGLSLLAAAQFMAGLTAEVVRTAGVVALVGAFLATAAATVPALLLERLPMTPLLAED